MLELAPSVLVHWCHGAPVYQYTGVLVHFRAGLRVHWCPDALILKNTLAEKRVCVFWDFLTERVYKVDCGFFKLLSCVLFLACPHCPPKDSLEVPILPLQAALDQQSTKSCRIFGAVAT